jgi:hypothetical protein
MKKLNAKFINPKYAQLNAILFTNSFLHIPPTLFYDIHIELNPFSMNGNLIQTAISLNFIRIAVRTLKEIEHQTFIFPINPVAGFIDGSLYLLDVHNPVDVKKIEFKNWENNTIDAVVYYDIDFEYENTGYEKMMNCVLNIKLSKGRLTINSELLSAENYTPSIANEMVDPFVSLNDYEASTLAQNEIFFKMLSK